MRCSHGTEVAQANTSSTHRGNIRALGHCSQEHMRNKYKISCHTCPVWLQKSMLELKKNESLVKLS